MSRPRPSRPFLDIRVGGVRLTVQRCPHRLLVAVGTLAGTVSSALAVWHR